MASRATAEGIWWPLYFRCGYSKSNKYSHCESGEANTHRQKPAIPICYETLWVSVYILVCLYVCINISMSCWNINLARFASFALEIAKHLSKGAVGPPFNGSGKYTHINIHTYTYRVLMYVFVYRLIKDQNVRNRKNSKHVHCARLFGQDENWHWNGHL